MILAGYVFDEPVVVSHQSFVENILPKSQILPHMMDTSRPSPHVPESTSSLRQQKPYCSRTPGPFHEKSYEGLGCRCHKVMQKFLVTNLTYEYHRGTNGE